MCVCVVVVVAFFVCVLLHCLCLLHCIAVDGDDDEGNLCVEMGGGVKWMCVERESACKVVFFCCVLCVCGRGTLSMSGMEVRDNSVLQKEAELLLGCRVGGGLAFARARARAGRLGLTALLLLATLLLLPFLTLLVLVVVIT